MTEILDVKYSALEKADIIPQEKSELEERYGVTLGKYVRRIRGIFGEILLFFPSRIGLSYPLQGREWEITYSSEEGPTGEGLIAVRPGADKPLRWDDYFHLYKIWHRDGWQEIPLYLLHDGQLYEAHGASGPPVNRLYLQQLDPCGR